MGGGSAVSVPFGRPRLSLSSVPRERTPMEGETKTDSGFPIDTHRAVYYLY